MKIAGNTDVGQVRSENQDNYCAGRFSPDAGFALVCDGMGGAAGGATASAMACNCIRTHLHTTLTACNQGFEKSFLAQGIEAANAEIFERAAQEPSLTGMGTTAVCALVMGDQAFISHVGDSRCYLLRNQRLEQLTRDHSYVQELLDGGAITLEEAEHHPQRGAITRALGVDSRVAVDFTSLTVTEGDYLLLCTDGLSKEVPHAELEQLMVQQPLDALPDALIAAANAKGGPDNITVVLVKIEAMEASHG